MLQGEEEERPTPQAAPASTNYMCGHPYIKKQGVVHRQGQLDVPQVSWTVVEILTAGRTNLVQSRTESDVRLQTGGAEETVCDMIFKGAAPLWCLLVPEPDHTGCLGPRSQQHRGTWG